MYFLKTMVNKYERKTKPIDKEQLAKAIESVQQGSSVYKASKQFGIAYETLRTNHFSSYFDVDQTRIHHLFAIQCNKHDKLSKTNETSENTLFFYFPI